MGAGLIATGLGVTMYRRDYLKSYRFAQANRIKPFIAKDGQGELLSGKLDQDLPSVKRAMASL
jgi:hypothetical protein